MNPNYLSCNQLKNFFNNDPILDWLDIYGYDNNYHPDKFNPDQVFDNFLSKLHMSFKEKTLSKIKEILPITTIRRNLNQRKRVSDTLDSIYLGKKVIYQGLIYSEKHQLLGQPDLLIRMDCLPLIFSDYGDILPVNKSDFPWTYVVVNTHSLKLHLNKDGNIRNMSKRYRYIKAQNIIDTICLNEILETNYTKSFLISKSSEIASNSEIKATCYFKYGLVDYQDYDQPIYKNIFKGSKWIKNLLQNGHKWSFKNSQTYPPELCPNMVNHDDYPWKSVKKEISILNNEITILYHCGIKQRNSALQNGIHQWKDCDSDSLKIENTKIYKIVNKMIELNKFESDIQLSPRILKNSQNLQVITKQSVEFYVDFETVINFDESCEDNEEHSLLFMIGCLCLYFDSEKGQCFQFKQFTCKNLQEESYIIDLWVKYMKSMTEYSRSQKQFKIYHWSHAEPVIMNKLSSKYSNKYLLPEQFQWTDLLQIFKNEPIVIKDVFSYSLKSVVKKLYQLGLIKTTWPQSEIMDGKNAMIYAWLYYNDKANQSSKIMKQIEKYNFIDCQVLSEITQFLRTKT